MLIEVNIVAIRKLSIFLNYIFLIYIVFLQVKISSRVEGALHSTFVCLATKESEAFTCFTSFKDKLQQTKS